MSKKSDKFYGMEDMFQQEIERKTAAFRSEIKKLDSQLDSYRPKSPTYDSGLTDVEDRNEVLALNNKKRELEERYEKDIESLTIQRQK